MVLEVNFRLRFSTPKKDRTQRVSTGGIKCGARSKKATAVYKKAYLRKLFYDYDRALARPPKDRMRSISSGGIKCYAMCSATNDVYTISTRESADAHMIVL